MRLLRGTKLFLFLFISFNSIAVQTTFHSPFRYYPEEIQNSIKSISGLAKSTGQSWRCVSQTRYKGKYTIVDSKDWDLVLRDTFIYTNDGYLSEVKRSNVQQGWSNISELGYTLYTYNYQKQLQSEFEYSCIFGACSLQRRIEYTYPLNGNACVALYYALDGIRNRWLLLEKDSVVFTRPQTDYDISNDFGHFVSHYSFNPDSTGPGWICNYYRIKVDSECTENKLALRGYFRSGDYYFDYNFSYNFNSSDWKISNLREHGQQCISLNGNCINTRTVHFKDSLGNDTIIVDYKHDHIQTDWRLLSTTHCKRSYDPHGNETSVIYTTFGADTQINQPETKIIRTYALINSVPINEQKDLKSLRFLIKQHSGSLQFSAEGISEVTIYNLAGNPVAHNKQKSASKVCLLSLSCSKIVPGIYVAQVIAGGVKSGCTFTISR